MRLIVNCALNRVVYRQVKAVLAMSWNPFKKAFSSRRARARSPKHLSRMQAVSKRMYKDMQKCNECETALVRAGQKMVSDIKSSSHGRVDPLKSTVEVLGGAMEDFNSHTKTIKSNQDTTFSEPIKRYTNVHKHVEFHARQRELKLQEFEKQQGRLDKLERKVATTHPSQTSSLTVIQPKLELTQRSLSSSRADYERIHQRMMQEMPQLLEGRTEYFEHCLQGVVKSQVLYFHDCAQSLRSCLEQLTGTADTPDDEELNSTSDKLLAEIKALSIVGSSSTAA